MRFKIIIEYDGTAYHGWQVQPDSPTIQGVLEAAIRQMLGESVRVVAAGRTDAGVHAAGQVVSFSLQRDTSPERLLRALNALTPRDITLREAEVVSDDFDPRRAARSRVYVYRIWTARWPSPFWRRYAWHVVRPLDCDAMRAAAGYLIGEHDFSSFRAAGCDAEHAVRRVLRSELEQSGPLLAYTIEATAFLRHMVRNIVGTLVEVGTAQRAAGDMPRLLAERNRTLAGPTVPACGLCLTEVKY
jgi:tRNA pseudouridine38-40 synthase